MTATELLRITVKKQIDGADEKSLKMVNAMLMAKEDHDWWDDLSDNAKASVNRGLKDAAEGKLTPNSEVMKKYKKWL